MQRRDPGNPPKMKSRHSIPTEVKVQPVDPVIPVESPVRSAILALSTVTGLGAGWQTASRCLQKAGQDLRTTEFLRKNS